MKLHWSPRSPFVRKVMIVLHEKGLAEEVELVRSAVMMAAEPNPDVLRDNPLGKIPTLVLDDGTTLFDSAVICAHLDTLGTGPALTPTDPKARIDALCLEALADGLTDVLLLWRIEMTRGTKANQTISDGFATKVRATLAWLEARSASLSPQGFGIAQAALVSALGQIEFRYPDCGWKPVHPGLAAWYATQQQRSSVSATAVKDDGALPMGDVVMPLRFDAPQPA